MADHQIKSINSAFSGNDLTDRHGSHIIKIELWDITLPNSFPYENMGKCSRIRIR